jgi:hypothetical protein
VQGKELWERVQGKELWERVPGKELRERVQGKVLRERGHGLKQRLKRNKTQSYPAKQDEVLGDSARGEELRLFS